MNNKMVIAALIALLLVTGPNAICLTFNVVEIPMPQYGWEIGPCWINKSGQVAGTCSCYNGYDYSQAFIYENGVTTPIMGLSGVNDINDQGLIVGSVDTGEYYYSEYYEDWLPISHACTWHSDVITDLGTLGGYCSGTNGVNNLGDIVGWSHTTTLDSHGIQITKPFIYTNGQMADLNQYLPWGSGWVLSTASWINDSRQIVGSGKLNGSSCYYFFDLGQNTIVPIASSSSVSICPSNINNAGTVSGSMLSGGWQHGALWERGADVVDIGPLPGYDHLWAKDINNSGQAVGYTADIDPERYAAFLFQCDTLININSLIDPASGWNIQNAWHISDAGWVLATASKPYTSSAVVILVPVIDTAATAKAATNDNPVSFRGIPVTAVFDDFLYIESIDRCSGIRVDCTGHTLMPGMAADVDGIIKTNDDGERYVAASHVVQNGQASVKPLGMSIKALGGGSWKTGEGGSGQAGVTGGTGLNNIGLLVRTWGTLQMDVDGKYYLDDGSEDKPLLEIPTGLSKPVGQMVRVNGISSCHKETSGNVRSLVRVTALDY